MGVILRPPQQREKNKLINAWDNGAQNVMLVEPCGFGKTVIVSKTIAEHDAPACAIAHRRELVGQISVALGREEIRHRVIGPKEVIQFVVKQHMKKLGKNYVTPNSHVGVAGVDTIIKRPAELSNWCKRITLWVQDEGHHILRKNKWGTAAAMFPNAKGLGPTATAERADGMGLGRHADGLMDIMVQGPTPRELINWGYLTDYKVYNPPSDFNREEIEVSKTTGEFTRDSVSKATRNSHVIGDIVKHYLRIAPGKLGVTFVSSVDIAIDVAKKFNDAGIPAAVVHAGTHDTERTTILEKFENRELLQLVNVDLFGEGFDLPELEVVQMARATKSYALYHQQFMRALRIMVSSVLSDCWGDFTNEQRLKFISESIKPHAIIIDHVNNIDTERGGHGLPDAPRNYTLDRREKRAKKNRDDVIPTRTCIECTKIYERIYKICPYCKTVYEPASRSDPKFVDGDLTELDAETLRKMRGEVANIDKSIDEYKKELKDKYLPRIIVNSQLKNHRIKQEIQEALRMSMAWYMGYQKSLNRSIDESQRRFYFNFGIDVLSAKALNTRDAYALAEKINFKLGEFENEKILS